MFPARFAALRDTAAFAQRFCERNGVDRDDALRLRLVIEELFTNTVRHGYGGESDAPIRIALEILGDRVRLLYEDSAPRYDPIERWGRGAAPLDQPLDERAVGGLGLALLHALAAEARYTREQGLNRLWLTLPRRQPTAARRAPAAGSARE